MYYTLNYVLRPTLKLLLLNHILICLDPSQ
jgi:hypothetical protein